MGNPPFLGGNKIRQGLGDEYVESLFMLYRGRLPAFADLACYWLERACYGPAYKPHPVRVNGPHPGSGQWTTVGSAQRTTLRLDTASG